MRICRSIAALALMVNLIIPVQAAEREERLTVIGDFRLARRVHFADPGRPPSLHSRTDWVEHVLQWRSGDGAITLILVDDGINLTIRSNVGNCAGTVGPLQYEGELGEKALFATIDAYLVQAIPGCLPKRIRDRHEFLRSRRTFGQAVEALKVRVLAEFNAAVVHCERPPQAPKTLALSRCSTFPLPSL